MTPYADEYRRYRTMLVGALGQVSDEAFFAVPAPGSNSIAIILQHLSGNLASRFTDFLTADGEKPWRDREAEFDAPRASRAAVMEGFENAWQIAMEAIEALGPEDRQRRVLIRGQPWSVDEALCRSVAHFAFHVGEVVCLARQHRGDDWRSLSIPRGGSSAYNQHPDRERGG